MGWGYPNRSDFQAENFDGRLLFHTRRDKVLVWEMEFQFKSLKDPNLLGDWCGALLVHLTMSFGVYGNIRYEPKTDPNWKLFVELHPHFKSMEKIFLRDVLKLKLLDMIRKIMSAYSNTLDSNGKVKKIFDSKKLTGVYEQLMDIQHLLLDVDYQKRMDLPEPKNPYQKATSYM